MKNKYLVQRGDAWHFDCKLPKRLGGTRVRCSLLTRDVIQARYIRDTFLNPIIAQAGAITALEMIAGEIKEIKEGAAVKVQNLKRNILKPDQGFTIQECFDKYLQYLTKTNLRDASYKNYRSGIRSVISALGNKEIDSLTKNDATKTRDALLGTISTKRVSFNFQTFRAFLKWCATEGMSYSNITDSFNIPLPVPRTEHTSTIPKEKADDCMNCHPKWKLVPKIARYTGMRLNEILRLRKKDIVDSHGVKCILIDEKSKTYEPRLVPIADKLLPHVKDIWQIASTGKKFDKYNKLIKKIKGCEKCKFHSWRVYANTQMMEQGIDRAVRMKILGHKDGDDIHTGYTFVELTQMKKAVDAIP